MAQIINVEKPIYIDKVINTYAKNKIGQYSKFLEKMPIYCTYYHINEVMSRGDTGTGNIESELGVRSPIRFNKLINFPLYNIPDLRPDINYDESGYDIELECNDIVILPNTIKPRSGDHFIISFPGIKEFLFRVNNFRYNTIQSNDFYLIDADIKDIGNDLELKRMTGQVIETYYTIFENIGTTDRCFVKSTDVNYLNNLSDLYYTLRDFYKNAFYINDLNSFTFGTGRWSETQREIYRYDMYLEKFINDSHIYYDNNEESSLIMVPNDVVQSDFKFKYNMTLYQAVINRNIEFLRPYEYIVTNVITMPYSIYNVMKYFGESADVFCYNEKPALRSNNTICSTCTISSIHSDGNPQWYDLDPMPRCTPTWTLADGHEYFESKFLKMIIDGCISTDDYCQLIIFNYLHNISMTIDRSKIIRHIDKNEHTFYYLPIIIYIIGQIYQEYFKEEKEYTTDLTY